jgi:hypothetical protein
MRLQVRTNCSSITNAQIGGRKAKLGPQPRAKLGPKPGTKRKRTVFETIDGDSGELTGPRKLLKRA